MSQIGTIYLLHFEEPFRHARHYLGWTAVDLPTRLDTHAAGNGARLLAAVRSAGITWRLARERQIKVRAQLTAVTR